MKSRSLKKSEFERFERLLAEIFSKNNITRPQIQIQNWYPRLWDTNNIKYNFGECSDFEHSKETLSLDSIPEKLSFSTSQLSVMDNTFVQAQYKYATDVDYKIYGGNTLYAEVIPEIKNSLARELGSVDNENWRFSPNGIVHYCHFTEWQNDLNVPSSDSVFKIWLNERAGLLSCQLQGNPEHNFSVNLVEWVGINLIKNSRILKMLDEMSGNRYKYAKEVLDIAQKIHDERPFKIGKSDRIVHHLVKSGALSLGVSIQCDVCSERSWYSLTEFNYKIRCPRCISEYEPPFSAPGKMKWAYKTIGAFNSENQANGMFTVLFSWHSSPFRNRYPLQAF